MNIKIISIGILLVAVLGSGYLLFTSDSVSEVGEHADSLELYEMSPGETVERMKSGDDVVVLDVRTISEYEEIHLKGALLLPVQALSQTSLNDIGLIDKDQEIILYCRSGARSKTAYNIMSSLGYTNVKSVAGGMVHWEEDSYPLTEKGALNEENNVREVSFAADGPKLTVDRKIHDFGDIPQFGGVVSTVFTVTNSGTKTLSIGNITTSCSCTSALLSSYELAVGESADLVVSLDPDLHEEPPGVFTRTVFIPSNDVVTPEMEVKIQVDILEGT